MTNDWIIDEYKERINELKRKRDLEQVKLDDVKDLRTTLHTEYEKIKEELDGLTNKKENVEKNLEELQKKELNKYSYILEMDDGTYEVAGKNDVKIVDDIDIITKSLKSVEDIALLQIHFTEIDKDKYNELQDKDWCPFVDLIDYSANGVIRFYNKENDKLIQMEWDIPRDDVLALKNLYVKEDSFWLDTDDGHSYMALIWNGTKDV